MQSKIVRHRYAENTIPPISIPSLSFYTCGCKQIHMTRRERNENIFLKKTAVTAAATASAALLAFSPLDSAGAKRSRQMNRISCRLPQRKHRKTRQNSLTSSANRFTKKTVSIILTAKSGGIGIRSRTSPDHSKAVGQFNRIFNRSFPMY